MADLAIRATRYPKFSALARAVNEFQRYIDRNAYMIPDNGARWRVGQVISTPFIESLVNSLLAKRFVKHQSMQWTPAGAHLLLQIRTRTPQRRPGGDVPRWYPTLPLPITLSISTHWLPDRPHFVMPS